MCPSMMKRLPSQENGPLPYIEKEGSFFLFSSTIDNLFLGKNQLESCAHKDIPM